MDKWHGRPPFGFEIGPEGYLAPNDEYDTAIALLDALDSGESKRALARTTGVPRSTIKEIEKNATSTPNPPPQISCEISPGSGASTHLVS